MKEKDIFTEIMNLIEEKTDMPFLLKDIPEWINKDEENKKIYKIYYFASNSRKF